MTQAEVSLVSGLQFEVETETGHRFLIDAAPEVGGSNAGPRPMELMVASIAGCAAMDVLSILRKMQQEVTGLQVNVIGERAAEHPKNFSSVHIEYSIFGSQISEPRVEQAIALTEAKYCSAIACLRPTVQFTSGYKIQT